MRVFAIGATGVLGREVVPLLGKRGHEVTVMAPDRLEQLPDGVTKVRRGLLDDDLDLVSLLAGHDCVVNMATSMPRDFSAPGAWEENTRIRREGTRRLVEGLRSAGVSRLVQMSITMAYADGGHSWIGEDAAFDTDPAREAVVRPIAELESVVSRVPPAEVAWTILRAARFVGPGTLQDVQRQRLAQGALPIPGDGSSFLALVHVADFADAVVAAVEQGLAGQICNVADTPVQVGDYLQRLARLEGAPPPVYDPDLPPDMPSHRVDSSVARSRLGWRPRRGVLPKTGEFGRDRPEAVSRVARQ
ncbi:NAD-dependent epimerase/dehydratase family protein [Salinactinospora qingdaonensis]|uniref:NAD(P)-dependent oxidoreductase n=1 Tax=Salinactinospora qingdaonensis TaxID=702744 RepID=A0ABP7GGP4_9ACTN